MMKTSLLALLIIGLVLVAVDADNSPGSLATRVLQACTIDAISKSLELTKQVLGIFDVKVENPSTELFERVFEGCEKLANGVKELAGTNNVEPEIVDAMVNEIFDLISDPLNS